MRLACSTVAISHVMHDAHTTLNLLRGISQILFFFSPILSMFYKYISLYI